MNFQILKPALSLKALVLAIATVAAGTAEASQVTFFGNNLHRVEVQSYQEQKFSKVVKQEYDFSCGSAALATMLSYFYEMPINERVLVEQMFLTGDQEKISKQGFSLLDMKKYLASLGLRAGGFKDSLSRLEKAGIPAIALINNKGYLHFVVVAGVTDSEVLISDPSLGLRVANRKEFEKQWNGILFVILDKTEVAKKHFNKDWYLKQQARLDSVKSMRDLSSSVLSHIQQPGYY